MFWNCEYKSFEFLGDAVELGQNKYDLVETEEGKSRGPFRPIKE